MRVQVGEFLFCQRTYLKLSAEVRALLMRKDGEPMSDTPQTHGEMPTDAERAPQAYYDTIGVGQIMRARILADLDRKAAPGAWVGPFRLPDTGAR